MLFSILHRLSGESRHVPDIGLTTIRLSQTFRIDPSTLVVTQLDAQNSRQETLFPDDSGNYLPVVGGQKLEVEGTSIDQAQGTQNGRPMRNGGPPSPPFTLFRPNQQTRNPFGVSNVRNRNTSRMDAENACSSPMTFRIRVMPAFLNFSEPNVKLCLLPETKYIEVTAGNDISVDKVNKVLSESFGKPTVICDIHGQAIPDTAETQDVMYWEPNTKANRSRKLTALPEVDVHNQKKVGELKEKLKMVPKRRRLSAAELLQSDNDTSYGLSKQTAELLKSPFKCQICRVSLNPPLLVCNRCFAMCGCGTCVSQHTESQTGLDSELRGSSICIVCKSDDMVPFEVKGATDLLKSIKMDDAKLLAA